MMIVYALLCGILGLLVTITLSILSIENHVSEILIEYKFWLEIQKLKKDE